MKVFPEKLLKVELERDYINAYEVLKKETDLTSNLTSTFTDKNYRGTVTEKDFKLISSEIGRGAICVFIGTFHNNSGTIRIRINTGFQILFSILLIYPFIGFFLILYGQGISSALELVPIFLILLLTIRFMFIGLSFKFTSRTGLKKLIKTLKITSLKTEV